MWPSSLSNGANVSITIHPSSCINDLAGVRVGHWTDPVARTGCTALIFDRPAPAGLRIFGGAPGVCEASLLDPSALASGVDGLLLTGGSAYGLDAIGGVRRYLEEEGRGFRAGDHRVPIVPGAVIFDLAAGDGTVRPGVEQGYAAAKASERNDRSQGAVGAGAGARVAKYAGYDKGIDSGLASHSVTLEDGTMVGALVVNNCFGAVVDPATGQWIAVPRNEQGEPLDYLSATFAPPTFGNTLIGAVVTNGALTKAEAGRIATMAMAGVARCVVPAFTPYDGDALFVASVGDRTTDLTRIGAVAARLVEECVRRTVVAS